MKHAVLAVVLVIAAGWALTQPVPECPSRADQSGGLSCELAVTIALGALPADHAAITRTQFLYGSPIASYQPLLPSGQQLVIGYVIFTQEDGSREYVSVGAFNGELTAAAPIPYPESSASRTRP